jgi:phospholipid transport system substrate-binding protein
VVAGAGIASAGIAGIVGAETPLTVAEAVKFIQQSGDRIETILNGPGDWPMKRPQVEALINQTVDVYGVARFSLGRFWKTASEEQRSECARLFATVLLGSVGRAVGSHRGTTFTVGRATQIDERVQVWTTLRRPDDQPREVVWIIETVSGAPKVVDVVAEGTSMRITQRDDTMSFLAHNNNNSIAALIDELHRRSAVTS